MPCYNSQLKNFLSLPNIDLLPYMTTQMMKVTYICQENVLENTYPQLKYAKAYCIITVYIETFSRTLLGQIAQTHNPRVALHAIMNTLGDITNHKSKRIALDDGKQRHSVAMAIDSLSKPYRNSGTKPNPRSESACVQIATQVAMIYGIALN